MSKSIAKALKSLCLLYCAIVIGFFCFQRQLIFKPQAAGELSPLAFNVRYEELRIPSSAGLMLHGWWVPQSQPETAPTLLYCHGNGADLSALAEVASIFHSWGLNALLFDYRGYGSSSPAPLSEQAVLEDSQAAYDWLTRAKGVPAKSIVFWGHSLGSAIAAKLATTRQAAGLILEGAFPRIYDVGRYRYPWLLLFPFMLFDPFATQEYLRSTEIPTLHLHAEKDSVIPLSLGQQLIKSSRPAAELIVLEGIDHNDFPSVQILYKERILRFIHSSINKP